MPFKNKPPLYSVWRDMRNRCFNKNFHQFADYGGRGITICDEWSDYKTFERDMMPRPAGFTLDRRDTNGNYEPSNCCWSSRKDQQRNQRRTIWVEVEGQKYKAIELAEKSGLKVDTIVKRAAEGMSFERLMKKTYYIRPDSTRAAIAKRVANQRARTHCSNGHEFTPENTYVYRGARSCRACRRKTPFHTG